jgi:hypothetical protein
MKKYFAIFCLIVSISFQLFAQELSSPFYDHNSERFQSFIPSDEELVPLAAKIKSLKMSAKNNYFDKYQTYAHGIFLDTLVKEGLAFLANNPSFEDFRRKFPMAAVQKDIAFYTSGKHQEEQGKKSISVGMLVAYNLYFYKDTYWQITVQNDSFDTNILKNKNLHILKNKYKNEKMPKLQVYFFEQAFKKYAIPSTYAANIDYVNNLLQETVSLNLQPIDFRFNRTVKYAHELPNRAKLFAALNKVFGDFYQNDTIEMEIADYFPSDTIFPIASKNHHICYLPTDTFKFHEEFWLCQTFKKNGALKRVNQNPQIIDLIHKSIDETIAANMPSVILEFFAQEFSSKQKLLILKRLRRVWASCGNDDAPRWHSLEIMKLAVETQNDSVFVRALLESLLNPVCNTKLNPSVRTQLLTQVEKVGIDLKRVYLSFILNKIGIFWSHHAQMADVLSYTKLNELENEIRKAIIDNNLDHYNRYLFWEFYHILYEHKIYREKDPTEKQRLFEHLNQIKNALPAYIAEKIVIKYIKEK